MQLQVGERQLQKTKQRVSSTRPANTATGEALANAGGKAMQVGEEIREKVRAAEKTAEYSSIIAQVKNEAATYYSTRSKDVDNYGTLVQDVDDFVGTMRQEFTGAISDPEQRSRIAVGIDNIGVSYHGQAINDANTLAITSVRADNVRTRASMVQEAAVGDDNHISSVIMNYAGMMRNYGDIGIYEMDDVEKDILSFATDSVRSKVRFMMNNNLEDAQEYLLNTDDNLSRLLEPEHRENLLSQVGRLIGQRDAKAERDRKAAEAQEEKNLKIARDATYQMSFKMIRDGEMTVGILDSYAGAGLLHKTDYDGLYRMYLDRDKDLTGNPEVYSQMLERAYNGNLSTSEIISARNAGSLSWDWVSELSGIVESGAAVTQSDEYKTYLTSLKTALGWAPSMAGFSSPAQSQLLSKAQLEYWKRAQAGESLELVYTDMVKRYQLVAVETYPKPRFNSAEEAKANIKPGVMLDRELASQKIRESLVMQKLPQDNTDLRN